MFTYDQKRLIHKDGVEDLFFCEVELFINIIFKWTSGCTSDTGSNRKESGTCLKCNWLKINLPADRQVKCSWTCKLFLILKFLQNHYSYELLIKLFLYFHQAPTKSGHVGAHSAPVPQNCGSRPLTQADNMAQDLIFNIISCIIYNTTSGRHSETGKIRKNPEIPGNTTVWKSKYYVKMPQFFTPAFFAKLQQLWIINKLIWQLTTCQHISGRCRLSTHLSAEAFAQAWRLSTIKMRQWCDIWTFVIQLTVKPFNPIYNMSYPQKNWKMRHSTYKPINLSTYQPILRPPLLFQRRRKPFNLSTNQLINNSTNQLINQSTYLCSSFSPYAPLKKYRT